jgi:SAM-dependent methyltransferase
MRDFVYHGHELELFAEVTRWKAYWVSRIRRYLGEDVLEVGAGIGTNTRFMCNERFRRWICTEPDAELAKRIALALKDTKCWEYCTVITGTLEDIAPNEFFDTILFIDVLEHIQDDRGELLRASGYLKPRGTLIVLSPAHACLFSKLDQAVGHYRRYTKKTLTEIAPRHLKLLRMEYLDLVGVLASLSNRFLLRQYKPTRRQIRFWDSVMVPCSRILDPLLRHPFGKSILAVWRNDATAGS